MSVTAWGLVCLCSNILTMLCVLHWMRSARRRIEALEAREREELIRRLEAELRCQRVSMGGWYGPI